LNQTSHYNKRITYNGISGGGNPPAVIGFDEPGAGRTGAGRAGAAVEGVGRTPSFGDGSGLKK